MSDKKLFSIPSRKFHTSKKDVELSLKRYAETFPPEKRSSKGYKAWKGKSVSLDTINRMFETFENACKNFGIRIGGKKHYYSNDELLDNFEEIWRWREQPPSIGDIKRYRIDRPKFPSHDVYVRRFGDFKRFIRFFSDYKLGLINKETLFELRPDVAKRTLISAKDRFEILKKAKYCCELCGASQEEGIKLHVDHIIPVSKGGDNEMDNLRCLCSKCNLGRSNRHMD